MWKNFGIKIKIGVIFVYVKYTSTFIVDIKYHLSAIALDFF